MNAHLLPNTDDVNNLMQLSFIIQGNTMTQKMYTDHTKHSRLHVTHGLRTENPQHKFSNFDRQTVK